MDDVILCKRIASLIPIDDEGKEALDGIGQGELVRVKIVKARNLKHHKKFFAMVNLVFSNQETFPTSQHLLTAIKLEAGWYEDVPVNVRGKMFYLPKSISFAKMTQLEFDDFYMAAIAAVCRLLPNMRADELAEEVQAFAA